MVEIHRKGEIVRPAAASGRQAPKISERDWLKALPPLSRWIFQGGSDARAAFARASQWHFAERACRATTSGTHSTLWLGPDEYLLLAPVEEDDDRLCVESAQRALGGIGHALVNVSHRQCAIALTGERAAEVLNGSCPLDLSLGEFPVGMCTRTAFAKADIVLWRTQATTFHVEIARSFVHYVTQLLIEIGAED